MGAEAILPTAAEVAAMRAGDRETINRYYMANKLFIEILCRNYCINRQIGNGLWEDMAHECYLYFAGFEFASCATFARNVRDVCVYVFWGGERTYHQVRQGNTEILTILDEPATKDAKHSDEGLTLGETIADERDLLDEIEPPPDYTEIVHDIAAAYLSPREKDAFDYFYYTDITAREVGEKLGISQAGAQTLRHSSRVRLQKHAEELREALLLAGVESESLQHARV